ncbi:hypothetical protein ABIC07_008405 [Bradyrhizobium sp. RT9a]
MAHHWDLAIDLETHHFDPLAPCLELHGSRAPLQNWHRGRVLNAEVKAEKAHIGDEQCARLGTSDRFHVVVHHRHTDWQRIIETEAAIADAVGDENHLDHGISDASRRRVISGRHQAEALPLSNASAGMVT